MDNPKHSTYISSILLITSIVLSFSNPFFGMNGDKPRIIATTDGEIDDQCSLVRFLLYTNEWDVEGIVTSSSQYHWQGHKWPGDDWIEPYLDAYAQVYPNLVKHDAGYPAPEYLRERALLGNVKSEGDMAEPTAGSDLIVKVLLDDTDDRPVWMQAWGGMNTIARALKTIEEEHTERMAEVAKKCRFFFIWEQDRTYQEYIRPVWGKYEIPTIISDQFEAIAYRWKQAQPEEMHKYFEGEWMKENILENHGLLCSIYAAHENGDFRSEGDSPAFLHTIVTGLRNMESPDWGGWGGRYVRVRENTWLDPVRVKGYAYPSGRWYGNTGWGRNSLRTSTTSTPEQRREYFKPMWRWTVALQNDFAARADWCVKSYKKANHPPVVVLGHAADLEERPGTKVKLSARGTSDPDRDKLKYRWWQYREAESYDGTIEVRGAGKQNASFTVPGDVGNGKTIHIICEVTDNGTPPLTRYQRAVIEINTLVKNTRITRKSDSVIEIPPLSAHFPLDDGTGTVVTEVVGGLNGTLNNTDPAVAWTSGVLGGALHLDGIDDRVIVPNNLAFDFADESFSVSLLMRWPKGGRSPHHEHLLTKGDYSSAAPGETGKRWEIAMDTRGLRFNIDDDVNKSQIQIPLDDLLTGEWVHIVAVRDTTNKLLKVFVDGELRPSTDLASIHYDGIDRTGSIANPQSLFIGDASRRDNPFKGELDDIRIFRSALSMHQVAALTRSIKPAMKNANKVAASSPIVATPQSPKAAAIPARAPRPFAVPSLLTHWPLNDKKGTVVKEVVGGHNGELTNADTAVSWISGKRGGALRLDGINDRIFVPHDPAFDFAEESFTAAFWMRWKKGVAPHSQHFLTKGDYHSAAPDQTGRRWEIFVSGRNSMCFTIDDDVVASRIQVPLKPFITGEWVHVAAIRDMAKNQLRLYANGVPLPPTNPEKAAIDGVDRTGSISNPQRLTIGDAYLCDNPFAGDMDDIRIYLGALTEQQIADIATLAVQASPGVPTVTPAANSFQRPRVIVTSDAEIDDECSFVRCLLYANDFDIEGIISTSSQYHAHDHRWAGDNWYVKYLDAYTEIYPNLVKHDSRYPTPKYLKSITFLGNVDTEGDMKAATPGSDHIVKVLLDETNDRPIWLQAWGGMNTIARALKTIEEDHPDKMEYVAKKCRFFLIWEQDKTYQEYIKPIWGKYNILTIISDQFVAFAYFWKDILPAEQKKCLVGSWMKENILQNHGPLCALYKSFKKGEKSGFDEGDFRSEGDSPSYMHEIPVGLQNLDKPDWGGWGGRYVKVRDNTWLDPVLEEGYTYPEGRWYTSNAWGRNRIKKKIKNDAELTAYLKPIWRWMEAFQNDFASRADWCVTSFAQANHPPVVVLAHAADLEVQPGATVKLSARGTSDPDGDKLKYRWWQYREAGSYDGTVEIRDTEKQNASFTVPGDAGNGKTIHVICEVTDNGIPQLTRYQRVVVEIE